MEILKNIGMSIVELALYLLITGVFGFIMIGVITTVDPLSYSNSSTSIDNPYAELIYNFIPLCIATFIGTFIVHKLIFHRSLAFSGFSRTRLFKEFSIGFGWSIVAIGLGFCLLLLPNFLDIVSIDFKPLLLFGFLLMFIVQSSVEEIVCRSFLLPTIAHRFNIIIGLAVSSVVFGLLHWSNANMSVLGIINLVLAGVLLGVVYLRYRRIWAPIGLHAGWNFLQGNFFGFEVSGISVPSFIDTREVGPDILTGGAFGFEGSIIATFIMLGVISIIWREAPSMFRGEYLPSS